MLTCMSHFYLVQEILPQRALIMASREKERHQKGAAMKTNIKNVLTFSKICSAHET